MREGERKAIRDAKLRIKAGDRAGALAALEAVLSFPRPPRRSPPGQMALTLAPLPLHPDQTFVCETLQCERVAARVCVARQKATEAQRTEQKSRGQGTEYPACDPVKCARGRAIREAIDPDAEVTWAGSGPGGRFQRERPRAERVQQQAARDRLARVGLLDEERTLDIDPDPADGGA